MSIPSQPRIEDEQVAPGAGQDGKAFANLGLLSGDEIGNLLAQRLPSLNLERTAVDPSITKALPLEMARRYRALPLVRTGSTLTIAMANPANSARAAANLFAVDDIKFITGFNVDPIMVPEPVLEEAILRCYGPSPSTERPRLSPSGLGPASEPLASSATLGVDEMLKRLGALTLPFADETSEPVIRQYDEIDLGNLKDSGPAAFANRLTLLTVLQCVQRGASDIHIEPSEREVRVRCRIDGDLFNLLALPTNMRDPLISRIKVLAKLDLTERRLPQEGRIKLRIKVEDRSRDLDFRVSIRPTMWGERVVMQLAELSKPLLDTTQLGMEPRSLEHLHHAISRPSGLVLFTGPRGSGKVNTFYGAVAFLNKPAVNIMMAEDLVELALPGITQVQTKAQMGESAATVLRSLSSQDADVLGVNPIREAETAEAAVGLALGGRLLLATLGAGDAPSAVSHLESWGIHRRRIAQAVTLILAQRLVRRICLECVIDATDQAPSNLLTDLGLAPAEVGLFRLMKGRGCPACHGSGYKGRIGLFEAMPMSEDLRELMAGGATPAQIRTRAVEEGMLTLRMSGLEKIKKGLTTVDEVSRQTLG